MKYAFIKSEEKAYPREMLCRAMNVSPRGYVDWKRGGSRQKRLTDLQLPSLIEAIHRRVNEVLWIASNV